MIEMQCSCGATFEIADDQAAKQFKCPVCRKELTVPAHSEAPQRSSFFVRSVAVLSIVSVASIAAYIFYVKSPQRILDRWEAEASQLDKQSREIQYAGDEVVLRINAAEAQSQGSAKKTDLAELTRLNAEARDLIFKSLKQHMKLRFGSDVQRAKLSRSDTFRLLMIADKFEFSVDATSYPRASGTAGLSFDDAKFISKFDGLNLAIRPKSGEFDLTYFCDELDLAAKARLKQQAQR